MASAILSWQSLLAKELEISDASAGAICDWLTDGYWPISISEHLAQTGMQFSSLPKVTQTLLTVTAMFAAQRFDDILTTLGEDFPETAHGRRDLGILSKIAREAPASDSHWPFPWHCELAFFLGSTLLTIGQKVQAEHLWFDLEEILLNHKQAAILASHRQSLVQKIAIERGVTALNHGDCHASTRFLSFLMEDNYEQLGTIPRSRGLAALTIAWLQLREFKRARKSLESCRTVTAPDGSPPHTGILRLEVMLAMAQENYDEAQTILSEAKIQAKPLGRADLLFRQKAVGLALLRNQLAEAQALLSDLMKLQEKTGISKNIINPAEQWLELELRASRVNETLISRTQIEIDDCQKRGDRASELRLRVLQAAMQTSLGLAPKALHQLESICADLEKLGLYGDLADALFHAMGAAFRSHHDAALRRYLIKGSTLAKQLGLTRRKIIFDYLRAMCHQRQKPGAALAEILKASKMSAEINFYLDHYGILDDKQFIATSKHEKLVLSESGLRHYVWQNPGIYFFRTESLLVVHVDGKISADLRQATDFFVTACQSLIRNQSEGLSLEDFHALKSRLAYHKLRHSGAARTALHRVNSILKSMGAPLTLRKASGKYCLPDHIPAFEVE
jgi:hypothetical protein